MIPDGDSDSMQLFDCDGKPVGAVNMRQRLDGQPPRRVVWRGRVFVEGGEEGNFYGPCEMGEIELTK